MFEVQGFVRMTRRRVFYAGLAALCSAICSEPVVAQVMDYTRTHDWQALEGDWATAANWFDIDLGSTATSPPQNAGGAGVFGPGALVHYNTDGFAFELNNLEVYDHGTLSVETGVLNVGYIALSLPSGSGPGFLDISGGEINVDTVLYVGISPPVDSTPSVVTLSGGTLNTSSTYMDTLSLDASFKQFVHSGGTHATQRLSMGFGAEYLLSGTGQLLTSFLSLSSSNLPGQTSFEMTGGSADINSLSISSHTQFLWSGGTLDVDNLSIRSGTSSKASTILSLPTGPSSLTLSGVVDLSGGTLENTTNASWTLGPNSLLVLPANGTDPRTGFANFDAQGIVHQLGQTLVISDGQTVQGAGNIYDEVDISGSLIRDGYGLNVINGGVIRSSAFIQRVGFTATYDAPLTIEGGIVDGTRLNFVGFAGGDPAVAKIQGGVVEFDSIEIRTGSELYVQGGSLHAVNLNMAGQQGATLNISNAVVTVDLLEIGISYAGYVATPVVQLGENAELWADQFNLGAINPIGGAPLSQLQFTGKDNAIHVTGTMTIYENARVLGNHKGHILLHGAGMTNLATNVSDFAGFDDLTVTAATSASQLEVGGRDLGAVLEGFVLNFSLEAVNIADGATLSLLDDLDNQPIWVGTEALYVDALTIGTDSTLLLNGINIYTHALTNLGTIDASGGGSVSVLALLFGDANNDGVVDTADFLAVESNMGQIGDDDGALLGDANGDGRVDGDDWITVGQSLGATLDGPPIPEPASGLLVLLSVGLLTARHR